MTDTEKTSKLLELIDDLCDPAFSQDNVKSENWILQLNEIYANGYRHNYADLFFKLQTVLAQDVEIATTLGENLNVLEERIKVISTKKHDDANIKNTADSYKKFADHIRLEIGRYNFIKEHFANHEYIPPDGIVDISKDEMGKIKKQIETLSKDLNTMRPITTQAKKELESLDAKLENNKISSLTTLTVFSAVVLAFSGGITFEAGMLQGMADASSYRLVFTIALVGFVLFNTIFALLYLVGKLSDRVISTRCRYISRTNNTYSECKSCGEGYCVKPYGAVTIFCRFFHKYSYVLAINIILLWIMYADFVLWIFKDVSINSLIVLYISMPAMLGIFALLCNTLAKRFRRNRIILACKINLIEKILKPQDMQSSVLSNLGSIISKAFGVNHESHTESYLNLISGERMVPFLGSLRVCWKTNQFVIKNMLTSGEMTKFISREEHWKNKKIWRDQKKKLIAYVKLFNSASRK